MNRKARVLALVLASACTSGHAEKPAPAPVLKEAPIAVVQSIAGDTKVKRADADEWIVAEANMELRRGDKLRTYRGSATLAFTGGSSIAMAEDSLLAMPATAALSNVRVEQGNVNIDVVRRTPAAEGADPAKPNDFVVETPSARARVAREIVFQ